MRAWKFLAGGALGRFSEFVWPQPAAGRAGAWVAAEPPVDPCRVGIHACSLEQLPAWIDDELWEIELGGAVVEETSVLVAERGRLLRRVEAWDSRTAQEFTDACAWRARGQALRALRREGLTEEAERLVAAAELEEMHVVAVGVAAGEGAAAEAAGFAADVAALARGRRPETWDLARALEVAAAAQTPGATAANLAFVIAHAAGREAPDYEQGFAAERSWQVAWLVERLGLPG